MVQSLSRDLARLSYLHHSPLFGVIQQAGDEDGDFIFIRQNPADEERSSERISPTNSAAIDLEVEMWELVKKSTEISDLRDFLQLFPNGKLAPLAKLKLKQLERQGKSRESGK